MLDDARAMLQIQPLFEEGDDMACRLCGELISPYPDFAGHESDCPWISLPKIVAALEAAERVITWDRSVAPEPSAKLVPASAYDALVAALKGET